ncbi:MULTISPECIES: DUF6447 family protein [unclassified Prochlorococcus]|uniref:DUF6447 family protein n=1 Tax=unclassified Prochlorococcus TaxID=2627481 RepID=UPI000533AD89|nr:MULTISPECIES: DUF6447 family protein [unclassified Prochlorococcus]KGG15218.1 hypothetical protein EV06_1087 [Prochlorococcus sp. MIT 0602]KGG17493.1 hypothetical protein EV07_0933 [Prochlorococcus sp. MIT 0603]
MADYEANQADPILTFDEKRYNINSLPNDVKELVKGLQIADSQLRLHEDTLKVLAVGRQSLIKELSEKLKDIPPLANN